MSEVLRLIANSVVFEVLQLIAGFILADVVYIVFCRLKRAHRFSPLQELLMILFTAAVGMALPLSGFAVVPIIAVLVSSGYPPYTILPIMLLHLLRKSAEYSTKTHKSIYLGI